MWVYKRVGALVQECINIYACVSVCMVHLDAVGAENMYVCIIHHHNGVTGLAMILMLAMQRSHC